MSCSYPKQTISPLAPTRNFEKVDDERRGRGRMEGRTFFPVGDPSTSINSTPVNPINFSICSIGFDIVAEHEMN